MPRGSKQPERSEGSGESPGGHRVLFAFLLLIASTGALLAYPPMRGRLLDMLFGAEEEFEYSSLTEPVRPTA